MSDKNDSILQTVKELRDEFTKALPDPVKVKKMNEFLDGFEAANQEVVTANAARDQKNLELEEKLQGLEVEVSRNANTPGGNSNYKESSEYKTLNTYCIGGEKAVDRLEQEQKAALRTDIDPQGGYLVPRELDNVIVKKIIEVSPIRSIARVRTTAGKTLDIPVRNTIPAATFEGEAEEGTESNSTYQSETLTPFRLTYTSPITMDMLMDAAFDMESEILSDAAEAFAFTEGNKFVLGTGAKQPTGFLADTRVTDGFRVSETSGVLSADDILLVTGDLKTGYNPTFVMNRRTIALLRTQKSTTGQYLWTPGINGIVQNTLAGEPYIIANDMPDIASDAFAVAYGDFLRGYTIIDRTGLSIIRDELTQKKKAIVEFTMNRWLTGQVVLPEAITGIKIQS